jgi:hypothetical protein
MVKIQQVSKLVNVYVLYDAETIGLSSLILVVLKQGYQ